MFLNGFVNLLDPLVIILMISGVIIGIIFGAVPGLSATMAVTLFLPLTFAMGITPSIALLLSLYVGGLSGGLISAILINIPGTPSSIATTFDGAPMARNGQAGKALGTGVVFSFLGGLLSFIAMALIAPEISSFALKFSNMDYFAVTFFSLTLVASIAGKDQVKGLISACIGLFLAQIGAAPIDGTQRFTFGIKALNGGFDIVAVMIGMFAITEIINAARNSMSKVVIEEAAVEKVKGFGFSFIEFIKEIPNFIRSALIGVSIGILPGIGGGTSNILSYLAAKKSSKHPEKFGTGCMSGVVASETANNAAIGGAIIPLLTLGIPGDPVTAVLMGALIIQGVTPGPLFIRAHGDLFYIMLAVLIVANILMLFVEFFGIKGFVKILKINKAFLFPSIVILCAVGAFGSTNRVFNIYAMVTIGIIAYIMIRGKFPLTPIIISYILGTTVEANLRRGLMFTDGNFLGFFNSGIACVFIILAALMLLLPFVLRIMANQRKRKANSN